MAKNNSKGNVFLLALGALLCCALWGSAFPGIKIGYKILGIDSSNLGDILLFAGVRFFLAGILAIIIGSILYRKVLKPKKTSWGMIFRLSLLQTVCQYFFFYLGLAYTTGVQGSMINALSVFITLLLTTFIYKQEKMTSRKIIGCIAGFLGVNIVVLFGTLNPASGMAAGMSNMGAVDNMALVGDGLVLISVISSAASACRIKQFSKKEEPFVLSGYQFILGGLILSVTGYAVGGRIKFSALANTYGPLTGWMVVLHLAFVSAVAYSLWGVLLKRYRVSQVTVFGFLTPIFGALMSVYALKEDAVVSPVMMVVAFILVAYGTILCVGEGQGNYKKINK